MVYLKSNDDTDDFNHIDAGEFVHYGANNDEFEDLSETRKGIAWKHFWYNKVQDLSKCMHCNQTIKNHGKTKVLLDHLVTAHEFEGIKPDFDCMEFEDISGRKKNEVWKHFLRSTCGEAAKCIHCQKILKTGSKASTSGISYHLSSVHKISITRKKKASMTMMEGHPMMTEASPVKEEASTEAPEYVDVKFETCWNKLEIHCWNHYRNENSGMEKKIVKIEVCEKYQFYRFHPNCRHKSIHKTGIGV